MNVTFLAALLVQSVMVALIRHRLGHGWLRRPVTVFILASLVYLGLGPTLLAIPSIGKQDTYRLGVQPGYIDLADLIMSSAMLALTLTYLLTRPERIVTPERPGAATVVAKVIDWRWLALACIPLTLLTVAGRGYNNGQGIDASTSLWTSLVVTFFIIVVVVTAAAFLLRHGSRWFLPVLFAQSGVLTLAGERTPVLMDAIALILMLAFVGIRVPPRQIAIAALLTVVVILSLTGFRAQQGRSIYYTNSGISARAGALTSGLSALTGTQSSAGTPGLITQFATRMSAVDYGGAILEAISDGQPRLRPDAVPESLLLVVPSFLWPAKLAQGNVLAPAQMQIDHFGLNNINFIPGAPGVYIGFLTPAWLIILFSLLGASFGWFERWLLRECTPARVIMLAGAAVAAMHFEDGLPAMMVQMRSAAVLALVAYAVTVLRAPRKSRSLLAPLPDPGPGYLGGAVRGAGRLGQGPR